MLRNPARCARRESKSALRCFISTATKRASRETRGERKRQRAAPGAGTTTVVGGQSRWLCGNPDRVEHGVDVSSRRFSRSSRSTVANDSTCHRFRRARVDNSRVSVFFLVNERTVAGAPPTGSSRAFPLATAASRPSCVNAAGVARRGHGGPVYRRGFAPRHAAVSSTARTRRARPRGDRQPSQEGLHRRVSPFGLPATLAGLVRPVRDERGVIHVVRGCAWVGLARAQPSSSRLRLRDPGPHRAGASE